MSLSGVSGSDANHPEISPKTSPARAGVGGIVGQSLMSTLKILMLLSEDVQFIPNQENQEQSSREDVAFFTVVWFFIKNAIKMHFFFDLLLLQGRSDYWYSLFLDARQFRNSS